MEPVKPRSAVVPSWSRRVTVSRKAAPKNAAVTSRIFLPSSSATLPPMRMLRNVPSPNCHPT